MMDNKEGKITHLRKYLGVMLEINEFKYFAPLSSPKQSDINPDGSIRSSSRVILRMVDSEHGSSPKLLGSIKLNNMIPVPETEIIEYNNDIQLDTKYKDVVDNELIWIQRNNTDILKAAKLIYSLKCNEEANINNSNKKFYESIIPFPEAEIKCKEYMNKKN